MIPPSHHPSMRQRRIDFTSQGWVVGPPPLKERRLLDPGALLFLKEILPFHDPQIHKKRQKKEVVG